MSDKKEPSGQDELEQINHNPDTERYGENSESDERGAKC